MKFFNKIQISFFILFFSFPSFGQSETYLQAFSSPILLNPGLAGQGKNSSLHIGNQYYRINSDRINNLFYATYDTYLEKLGGGIAFAFQNGTIGEMNTNVSTFSASYAGFETKINEGSIRFLLNAGVSVANKNWLSALLDGMFLEPSEEPSPPGAEFNQFVRFKPGTGFLYHLNGFFLGASAYLPFEIDNSNSGFGRSEEVPYSLSLYLSKKIEGHRKGIKSKPKQTQPELFVFYNDEFILSRASLTVYKSQIRYGAFLQSDFTNNIHTLGGNIGCYVNNMCFNLHTGVGIPGVSDDIGLCCELSFSIIVPPELRDKINPWAPQKN